MQKILLAIDGLMPSKTAFSYAVELCRQIRTELKIVQIIDPLRYRKHLQALKQRMQATRQHIGDAMVAASFAEAGEHEMAQRIISEARRNTEMLLPESRQAGVSYNLSIESGDPVKQIRRHVNEDRDVVFAVYDASADRRVCSKADRTRELKKMSGHLAVPLVVIDKKAGSEQVVSTKEDKPC